MVGVDGTPDVLIVGAGPAGALLATLLAGDGVGVTLVDRARFPRWTVCGACLSGTGVGVLREEGLDHLLQENGAVPLTRLEIRGWGRDAVLPVTGGRALSRAVLDQALLRAAQARGADVRTGTAARLGPWREGRREVELTGDAGTHRVRARVVVAATGLHPMPRIGGVDPASRLERTPGSRIGIGAVVGRWSGRGPARGTIRMIASDPGYVGQVRQEDGRWVVAGALDPDLVRERGGPEAAVRAVLAREGIDGDWTVEEGWRGTPLLTHGRGRVWEDGVFYLGDAAGYVEPFTGEGMGWALLGARHLRPLVRDGAGGWTQDLAERWDRRYRQGVGGRQRTCRRIAWLSRHPRLARSALALLSRAPWLAAPAIRGVAAPPP